MVAFSRKLKPTDVRNRFSWPTRKLHLLPPFSGGRHEVQFTAVDVTGEAWTFTCSIRRQGLYPKPVLTGSSWLPFVRNKDLVVGDMVVFYYDPQTGFQIWVRKLKDIRLMGSYITAYANEE